MDRIFRVTSRWYGELSFPNFLEDREESLLELKRQLNQLPIPEVSTDQEPEILVTTVPQEWTQVSSSKIVWLHTAPVTANAEYPTFLDIAESAKTISDSRLFRCLCNALAPTWEKLVQFGLANPESSKPRWDDIDGDLDDVLGPFLIGALARSIASLGPSYGVIFRHVQFYDAMSESFVRRLLREASLTGFRVAFEGTTRRALDHRYGSLVRRIKINSRHRQSDTTFNANERVIQFLAVCNQGLPVWLLTKIFDESTVECVPTCEGPTWGRWAYLPSTAKLRIRKIIPLAVRNRIENEIFEAWPPDGWGYLRRATHAFATENHSHLLKQHTPYVYGMRAIGRNFVQRQFIALSSTAAALLDDQSSRQSFIGAARLTSMVFRNRTSPVRYYKRALRGAEPILAANLIYEIANLYARRRNPKDQDYAHKWCLRGISILSKIENPSAHLYSEIRFHNILALIAYHAGNNQRALTLERDAYCLALRAARKDPMLSKWAKNVIRANMARVQEKGFRNISAAMALLRKNLIEGDFNFAEHARIELARLNLEQGKYLNVINLLCKDYESQLSTLNEQREFLGELMLSIGLTMLNEQKRLHDQLRRVAYLYRVVGASGNNLHGIKSQFKTSPLEAT